MNTISMKDVAEKAGVTRQTVSYVLNNKPTIVKRSTREKILKIVRQLNYQPNQFACSLKTGKTGCIGIATFMDGSFSFLERFNHAYLGLTYAGIGRAAGEHNYRLIFDEVMENNDTLDLVRRKMVEGIIFVITSEGLGKFNQVKEHLLGTMTTPYIITHSLSSHPDRCSIGVNCRGGAFKAVEHLVGHGYKTIGCVTLYPVNAAVGHHQDMLDGYRQALDNSGVPYNEEHIYRIGGWRLTDGQALARRMLEQGQMPRALFCCSDIFARGVMLGLHDAGVRVPEDVAIISYGEEDMYFNEYCRLSAVRHPAREKGYQAGKRLFAMIDNPAERETTHQELLDCRLVIRRSCGCK